MLEGIAAAGLQVGTDVSLITSDPGPLAQVFRPPLAAIVRDGTAIGRQAAELLLERIVDRQLGPRTVLFPARFEPRASARPPRPGPDAGGR